MVLFRHKYMEEESGGDGGNGGGGGLMADALNGSNGNGDGDGNNGNAVDGGGNGEGGTGDGGGSGNAGGANGGPGDGGEGAGTGDKATRPEYLPEQFWDAEKGEAKLEAMAKSHKDTREALKKAQGAKPPEKSDDYKITLPEGVTVDDKDPVLSLFKNAAHKTGLSQEQFDSVLAEFMPEAAKQGLFSEPAIDSAAEIQKLGPAGDAIVKAVVEWGNGLKEAKIWTDDDFANIVMLGSTAEGITALNKLREAYGGERIPTDGGQRDSAATVAAWQAKFNEKNEKGEFKYQVDPAFRKEVDEEGKLIFGTQPAHSGPAGLPT